MESRADSNMGAGLRIRGEISGDASLHFEGEIEGTIQLRDADLTVGSAASVRGHVQAREVRIEGRVEGDIRASARIVLRASSHVDGDLISPRIAIEDGARFAGRVDMARPGATSSTAARSEPKNDVRGAGVEDAEQSEPMTATLFGRAKLEDEGA
jgi:cytoskeletal protein CcmA (bactofilin family)